MIEQLITQISPETADRRGGNKKCFIKGAYALLYGSFKPDELDKTIKLEQQLTDEGVSVIPTIEYKSVKGPSDSGFYAGWILQRKAPGEELFLKNISAENYARRLNDLSDRPQEFYDKFAADWIKIQKRGLMIDPSKSANFFYTPEQIHFIDLNFHPRETNTETAFREAATVLFNGGMYYKYDTYRKQQQNILRKISTAFGKQGADKDKMYAIAQNAFPEIANGAFPPNLSTHPADSRSL